LNRNNLSLKVVGAGAGAQLDHTAIRFLSWKIGKQSGGLAHGNW
jgi:hypothetical protein